MIFQYVKGWIQPTNIMGEGCGGKKLFNSWWWGVEQRNNDRRMDDHISHSRPHLNLSRYTQGILSNLCIS